MAHDDRVLHSGCYGFAGFVDAAVHKNVAVAGEMQIRLGNVLIELQTAYVKYLTACSPLAVTALLLCKVAIRKGHLDLYFEEQLQ